MIIQVLMPFNNEILYRKHTKLFTTNFLGDINTHKDPLFTKSSNNSNNTPTLEQSLTKELSKFKHGSPINAFRDGKFTYTGDSKGILKVWSSANIQLDSAWLLSTAITHINEIDQSHVFASGMGRGTIYNLKIKKIDMTFRGHVGHIESSAISADKVFLATTGQDSKLMLWSIKEGNLVATKLFEKMPSKVTFLTDNRLKIEFPDGDELIWDCLSAQQSYLNKEREILLSTAHTGGISSLQFSKDGNRILSCDDNGMIKTWDVSNMVSDLSFYVEDGIRKAIYSLDEKDIFTFTLNQIYQLDAKTGLVKRTIPVPPLFMNDIGILDILRYPNNSNLFVNNLKGPSQFWAHTGTGQMLYNFQTDHPYAPYGIAMDSTNKRIATSGSDAISIWDMNKPGEKLLSIPNPNNHNQNIYVERKVHFSPSGNRILFDRDDEVIIWDIQQGKQLFKIEYCQGIDFRSDHEIIYVESVKYGLRSTLIAYDLDTKKELYREHLGGDKEFITILTHHKGQDVFALGKGNGHIEIRDGSSGQIVRATKAKNPNVRHAEFNPVNGHIALSTPQTIHLIDWKQLKYLKALKYPIRGTPNFSYSPGGSYFIVAFSNMVQVFDPVSYELLFELPGAIDFKVSQDDRFISLQNHTKETQDIIYVYRLKDQQLAYQFKLKEKGSEFVADYGFVGGDKPGIIGIKNQFGDKAKDRNSYLCGFDFGTAKLIDQVTLIDDNAFDLSISDDFRYLLYRIQWNSIRVWDLKEGTNKVIATELSIDELTISPDNKHAVISDDLGSIHFLNIETGQISHHLEGHLGEINNFDFHKDVMLTTAKDGSVRLWHLKDGHPMLDIKVLSDKQYIFFSPEGYYTGTPGLSSAIFYKENDRFYQFDQFDLIYNRPDKVLSSVANNPMLETAFKDAYRKRLKKLGYETSRIENENLSVPEVIIQRNKGQLNTTSPNFSFEIKATDKESKLERLHVWVNSIPIYGMRGKTISASVNAIEKEIKITLSEGKNTVIVSVANSKGVESRKEPLYIQYNPVETYRPKTYFIGIGVSEYQDKQHNLSYATKDINDLNAIFIEKDPTITNYILTDHLATRDNIVAIKKELLKTNVNDRIILSFSGHGLLDDERNFYFGTYDTDFDQPEKKGLHYDAIEWLLDSIPARSKLVMMDVCHSGEVEQGEGNYINPIDTSTTFLSVTPAFNLQNTFQLMQELFADLSRGNGAVVISAAGGLEVAYEDEKWTNGVFTYCILKGLTEGLADINDDDEITVSELKSYVSEEVEKLTKGKQKPTSRQENLEFDFKVW